MRTTRPRTVCPGCACSSRACSRSIIVDVADLLSPGVIDDHARAKEFLAAAAGAFIDREFETKGLDFIDKERAKRHAQEQAEEALAQQGRF